MVAEIAERQHGVVARRQLFALGFGRGAIDHRIAAGRLRPLFLGVYAVGHSLLTVRGRWMAAVLACGEGALLSHASAGALWGFATTARSRIDVTAVGRSRSGQTGIALHQVRRLHAQDRAAVDGIPITSVARTLLDLAEVVSRRRLERAFEDADRRDLLDLTAVLGLLERSPGRRGHKPLGALLSERYRPLTGTRSGLERQFLRLRREVGLPPPLVNSQVAGYEVDMAWPDRRLVVELDSYAFHHTRAAFERDRARDAALQLQGYRVLRVTDRQLDDEPEAIVRTIRALLSAP
jgi:hypothetical protein